MTVAMDSKPIKAILFDLDNTLIETALAGRVAIQKVIELLSATLGQDDKTATSICDRFREKLRHETFEPSEGRSIDDVRVGHWEESIQEVVASCPRPSLPTECYQLWKSSRLELLSLSPEVRTLLKQLRTTYKLLLLTNGETQTQREKVEAVGCEEFFDAIVVGGEHAEQKPAASIFTHCFSLLGVQPEDCVMVGDSLDTDIEGGFVAGVRATVWINSNGEAPQEGFAKPNYIIPTVLSLLKVLASLQ